MPVSPQDYALWAAATGNPYPKTAQDKARLAPEVYDFNRGFGKFRGFNEVEGFQGDIVYDQPQSMRHYGENTLLQSPITPDNNIPKVAGQLNNSLTGQHYVQHNADDAYETGFGGTEQPRSLLEKAALGALGVGAVAAGVYGAQKLTGRDLGVGRVGGMVRDLGQRAKSGIKSALGIAQEAAEPSFVTREGAENVVSVAQHGISSIDDAAPGVVRSQNVVPAEVRVNQSLKSRIPDPWGESALGGSGQSMVAPAEQSVIGTQTSSAGLDPDIQSRISQFTQKIGYSSPALETGSMQKMRQRLSPGSVLDPMTGRVRETANAPFFTNIERNIRQMPSEEFVESGETLRGLLGTQRPIPEGSLSGVQRVFSADPRAATVQKQAEAIFQATGDPGVIRSAYNEAPGLPIRVTLPSGESVPTGSLYEAFGQVVNPETGVPVTTSRAESLQAALNMQSKMKARALEQLGVPSTYQPSQAELASLDPRTKKLLGETAAASEAARNQLAQAEASGVLYKLRPEVTEGIREVPVINETSGEVVGSRVVPEVEGMPTSEFYRMRAAGGAGRQETGGIGRRREALTTGADELGFNIAPGSMEDVSPVLYQVIDDTTGQTVVVQPHEVSPMQILSGAAKPVRGTSVEPQRIMGSEGRTYKGVASNVVDPGSFDPAMLSHIAEGAPERIDPATGLAYSVQAMGGKERAAMAAEQEALRQAGRYKESIQLGKKMAQAQTQRVLPGAQEGPIFTGMSNEQLNETVLQARNAGALDVEQAAQNVLSARAEQAEKVGLMKQRSELVKQALSGPLGKLPQPSTSRVKQPPSPPARTPEPSATIRTTREFVPTQLAIPGAGVAPAIQSNPALETAIATERYMGTRPSQKMRAALQQAMARAAVQQPTLF